MCKFGNKNVFLMLWHFLWNFFGFQLSAFTENWNFQFFLKSFPQQFLVLSHTLSIMVDNYAAFFNCTPVGRASDSMMAPT